MSRQYNNYVCTGGALIGILSVHTTTYVEHALLGDTVQCSMYVHTTNRVCSDEGVPSVQYIMYTPHYVELA